MTTLFESLSQYVENPIINGDFRVWQRGVGASEASQRLRGFPNTVNNNSVRYFADRFYGYSYNISYTTVPTIDRASDVPTGYYDSYYSARMNNLEVRSLGVNDALGFATKLEGFFACPFFGKTATISFWVKSSKAGVYCLSIQGSSYSYVSEYTISSPSTWEKKFVTLTFNSPEVGTLNRENSSALSIRWALMSGANNNTATTNSWISGGWYATSNQVNWGDSATATFQLANIQMYPGNYQLVLPARPITSELQLCYRYFEKSWYPDAYHYNAGETTYFSTWSNSMSSSYSWAFSIPFRVTKRSTAPNFYTISNPSPSQPPDPVATSSSIMYYIYGSGQTLQNVSGKSATSSSGMVQFTFSNSTVCYMVSCGYMCECEL